jgi:hypothetical protein
MVRSQRASVTAKPIKVPSPAVPLQACLACCASAANRTCPLDAVARGSYQRRHIHLFLLELKLFPSSFCFLHIRNRNVTISVCLAIVERDEILAYTNLVLSSISSSIPSITWQSHAGLGAWSPVTGHPPLDARVVLPQSPHYHLGERQVQL